MICCYIHARAAKIDRSHGKAIIAKAQLSATFTEWAAGQNANAHIASVFVAFKMVRISTLQNVDPHCPICTGFLIGDNVRLFLRNHLHNAFRLRVVIAQIDLHQAVTCAGRRHIGLCRR